MNRKEFKISFIKFTQRYKTKTFFKRQTFELRRICIIFNTSELLKYFFNNKFCAQIIIENASSTTNFLKLFRIIFHNSIFYLFKYCS